MRRNRLYCNPSIPAADFRSHNGNSRSRQIKDWHQFHGVDPQFFQIGDFFHEAGKSAFVFHSGGLVFCVAPDMKFIDDKVAEFPVRLRHIAPVKGVLHHAGVVGVFPVGAPDTLSGDRFGVGIEKNCGLVEKQAFFGVIGAVYAVAYSKSSMFRP